MTTTRFTTEQLIKRLDEQTSSSRYALNRVQDAEILRDIEMDLKLAEIARASLGARSVYFVEIEGDQDINAGRIQGKHRFDLGGLPDGINYLYAAPPAVNSDPIYQVQYGNDWRDVERGQYDDHAAHGSPVRIVYNTTPAPVVNAEPVAWQFKAVNGDWISISGTGKDQAVSEGCEVRQLYTAPPGPILPGDLIKGAAMIQGKSELKKSETDYRAIVERISEIVHGKVTDIDLLTVTIKSMKDKIGNSPVIPDDYFSSLVVAARIQADIAMRKYPQPNYVLNKFAEESGEVIKAVIHFTEGREEWQSVEGEIIDNLAMLIRLVTEGDLVIGFIPPDTFHAPKLPGGMPALKQSLEFIRSASGRNDFEYWVLSFLFPNMPNKIKRRKGDGMYLERDVELAWRGFRACKIAVEAAAVVNYRPITSSSQQEVSRD